MIKKETPTEERGKIYANSLIGNYPRRHFNADGSLREEGTGGLTHAPGKNEIGGFTTELPSPAELTQKDIETGD